MSLSPASLLSRWKRFQVLSRSPSVIPAESSAILRPPSHHPFSQEPANVQRVKQCRRSCLASRSSSWRHPRLIPSSTSRTISTSAHTSPVTPLSCCRPRQHSIPASNPNDKPSEQHHPTSPTRHNHTCPSSRLRGQPIPERILPQTRQPTPEHERHPPHTSTSDHFHQRISRTTQLPVLFCPRNPCSDPDDSATPAAHHSPSLQQAQPRATLKPERRVSTKLQRSGSPELYFIRAGEASHRLDFTAKFQGGEHATTCVSS